MASSQITLGYWKIRGLGFAVRSVLEYIGLQYNVIDYVEDEAPPKGWFDVKYNLGMEFPNLPYLFDGDLKISETLAIIRYLANKYDKSLLGQSVEDQARVDQYLLIIHGMKSQSTKLCYDQAEKGVALAPALENFAKLEKILNGKKFFVGNQLSLVDLLLLEYFELSIFLSNNTFFDRFPSLKAYYEALINLTKIKDWRQSERFIGRKFNGKYAQINN